MKTILKLILCLVLAGYLIYAFFTFPFKGSDEVCKTMNICIVDSAKAGFITQAEVRKMMQKVNPVGLLMDSIHGADIETHLMRNSFIKNANCYKSPGGVVNIIVTQRLPLLRVLADNGQDYYIDETGRAMNPQGYSANLIVATGHISKKYAETTLKMIGHSLVEKDFWNNMIEQIQIEENGDIILIPRVGNHIIMMGDSTDFNKKLRNLTSFYKKVMPQVGWNKYSRINAEHTNQIICTKSES